MGFIFFEKKNNNYSSRDKKKIDASDNSFSVMVSS